MCYRLDRVSRSVGDFADLIRSGGGGGLPLHPGEFDTSTPMGKAMMYIASVFAQLERETIAQRVRDNMCLLARTGRWLGAHPTGFRAERTAEVIVDGRARTACRLVPDPGGAAPHLPAVSGPAEPQRPVPRLGGGGHHRPHRAALLLPGLREILQNPVYCAADRDAWDYFAALGADLCFPGRTATAAGACWPKAGLHRRALPATRWTSGSSPWAAPRLCPARRGGPFRSCSPRTGPRRCTTGGPCCPACCSAPGAGEASQGPGRFLRLHLPGQAAPGRGGCSCPNLSGAAADRLSQFPRLAPAGELAREEQRAACRILLQRADWDGADLAFTLCRL